MKVNKINNLQISVILVIHDNYVGLMNLKAKHIRCLSILSHIHYTIYSFITVPSNAIILLSIFYGC